MKSIVKYLSAATVSLATNLACATPAELVIHNTTNVESNAYIDGTIPSPNPTKPNSTNKVPWFIVKLVCSGHTTNNKCPALIKMATDTAKPVALGTMKMDLDTGAITPSKLSANGYLLVVNGPGEATISKE